MATVNELSATARPKAGKGAARAVRREGRVPGVIYGDSKEPLGDLARLQGAEAEDLRRPLPHHRVQSRRRRHEASRDPARLPARSRRRTTRSTWISCASARARRCACACRSTSINADQAPGIKRGGTVNIVTHTIAVQVPGRRHSAGLRRRSHRPRDQLFAPPERHHAAGERARCWSTATSRWSPSCRRRATRKK